jgi:hypothetical protein
VKNKVNKDYLYTVRLKRNNSNPMWNEFFKNVSSLNGKSVDYSGYGTFLIKHHMDKDEEVTDSSLSDNNSPHRLFIDCINNYFIPHSNFVNIIESYK